MTISLTPSELLPFAELIAREAGQFIVASMKEELKVHEATHHDIKLELDSLTEKKIHQRILSRYPEHSMLGEEGGQQAGKGSYEWIIDPIDGTVNLAYGIPHFCVSVACKYGEEILVGVIYDPCRDEIFAAGRGLGATLNGNPIHVSTRTKVDEAILALGFSKHRESIDTCLELYQYYGPRARKLRAMGSAALDMAYISCGRLDAYIEQGIKIWDIAAGIVLLEEAGGKVELTPKPGIPHEFHICASSGRMPLEKR